MPTKSGKDTAAALEKFFSEVRSRTPFNRKIYLQTDCGGEFLNQNVSRLLTEYNVKLYHTHSTQKAFLAERKIRDLKQLFSAMLDVIGIQYDGDDDNDDVVGKNRIDHILEMITKRMNNKRDSRTNISPNEIHSLFEKDTSSYDNNNMTDEDIKNKSLRILKQFNLFKRREKNREAKVKRGYRAELIARRKPLKRRLKVGMRVYITSYRRDGHRAENAFVKSTTRKNNSWDTNQVFVISQVKQLREAQGRESRPESIVVYLYKLKKLNGSHVHGHFYREELRVVGKADNTYNTKKQFEDDFLLPEKF